MLRIRRRRRRRLAAAERDRARRSGRETAKTTRRDGVERGTGSQGGARGLRRDDVAEGSRARGIPCRGSLRVTPARGRQTARRSAHPPRPSRVRARLRKGRVAAPIDTARRDGSARAERPRKTDARRAILRRQTPDGQHYCSLRSAAAAGAPVAVAVDAPSPRRRRRRQ